VAEIVKGKRDFLVLGNLDAKRDWGFAPEYTDAMWRILQQDSPSNLVIATGVQYSVRDFCEFAFSAVGLDYQDFVKTSTQFNRPLEVESLLGDPARAKIELNWEAKTLAPEIAKIMVEADLERDEFLF
jgi:GDPmannose 4,6-dehydratase